MKVAIATPMYPPELGEPASYIHRLAERLAERQSVAVVALGATFEPLRHARLVRVSKRRPLAWRVAAFTWKLLWASSGADVIYSQRALAAGVPATLVGWLLRKPVVVNMVGDELGDQPAGRRAKLQAWVLRRARRVIVPSQFMANVCTRAYGVPAGKVLVLPPPLPDGQVLPLQPQREPGLTLVPQHRTSAAARQAMGNLGSGQRLIVVGDYPDVGTGHAPSLRCAAAAGPNVEVLGRVSSAEAWFLLRRAERCVVDTSDELGEAAGMAAAAAGCEVVTVDGSAPGAAPSWDAYVAELTKVLA